MTYHKSQEVFTFQDVVWIQSMGTPGHSERELDRWRDGGDLFNNACGEDASENGGDGRLWYNIMWNRHNANRESSRIQEHNIVNYWNYDVLLLLPVQSNKLKLEWVGPFQVTHKLTPVVYAVDIPGKRQEKIYSTDHGKGKRSMRGSCVCHTNCIWLSLRFIQEDTDALLVHTQNVRVLLHTHTACSSCVSAL